MNGTTLDAQGQDWLKRLNEINATTRHKWDGISEEVV